MLLWMDGMENTVGVVLKSWFSHYTATLFPQVPRWKFRINSTASTHRGSWIQIDQNGHISETKNDKNNPKVPKFSSCRGLSSTLWRKCGSTTLYAIFGLYGSVFGHFLGVIGVAQCGSMAQNMPLGPIETGEQKNLLPHQKWPWGSNFCEPNFQEFWLKW